MRRDASSPRRLLRWVLFLAAILAVGVLLSGCGGGGGAPAALPANAMTRLGQEMIDIEKMSPATLSQYAGDSSVKGDLEVFFGPNIAADVRATYTGSLTDAAALHAFLAKASAGNYTAPKAAKEYKDVDVRGEAEYLLGYAIEYQVTKGTTDFYRRNYTPAVMHYQAVMRTRSGFSTQAQARVAALRFNDFLRAQGSGRTTLSKEVKAAFLPLRTGFKVHVWDRTPLVAGEEGVARLSDTAPLPAPDKVNDLATSVLIPREAATIALQRLDYVYQHDGSLDAAYYAAVKVVMDFFINHISRNFGVVLALIFLALLVKLITIYPTTASYRSMRDMQRIQPLLAELQAKYKDDKAKFAEEQMKLMKEHKVNPLGGCLPMLIQIPVFIVVYQAVMVYAYNFAQTSFFWIRSLALPDIPLLILYLGSMIVSQKLTPTNSADPQVQQQQRMMTYFMPIFLMFVLINFASAFVLYWFFLNVFTAAHQYYLIKRFDREEAAAALATPAKTIAAPPAPAPSSRKKGKQS